MNVGKTLFAQVMEFVPWKTFGRIIQRHRGDAGVRTLGCADLFRVMAFAQLTWRESLLDIEVYLAANRTKLFHMGLKKVPARSTLSDALNLRDWRIYHALAMRLITRARELYAKESLDIGVICDQTIAMNGFYVAKDYPKHLRRSRFKDPVPGKALVFLTNNTALPLLTNAAL